MHGNLRVKGIYAAPRIWRGPAGDVPEVIQRNGIDPKAINVDTARLVKFESLKVPSNLLKSGSK